MSERKLNRGQEIEETLRTYFLQSGYFVVRGIMLTHDEAEITDIDLWLYGRPSVFERQRVNVDAKRKQKRAKAMERILFARGLQNILGLERCIVATTDKRQCVKSFGNAHDVTVLDGHFLTRLLNRTAAGEERLTEEDFLALLPQGDAKLVEDDWRLRFQAARSRLVSKLEFDGCNLWLEDMRYFLEKALAAAKPDVPCRIAYAVASYLLIGVDYSLRRLTFDDEATRRQRVTEGFTHGSRGIARTAQLAEVAGNLAETYLDVPGARQRLAAVLEDNLARAPANILGEFFSRKNVMRDIFNLARRLEAHAYARAFVLPGALEPEVKAVLGLVLDYHGMDRGGLFNLAK